MILTCRVICAVMACMITGLFSIFRLILMIFRKDTNRQAHTALTLPAVRNILDLVRQTGNTATFSNCMHWTPSCPCRRNPPRRTWKKPWKDMYSPEQNYWADMPDKGAK